MDEALRLAINQLDYYFYDSDHRVPWPVMAAYRTVRNSLCGEQPVVVGLNSFLGKHYLSGVEYTTVEDEYYEAIKFCLDGNTYIVSKDPSDGWRSYCREVIQTNIPCKNTFFPHEVCGIYEDNTDIIRFIDVNNGKMVFRFGTEKFDSYYPCCVMEWLPENLSANEICEKEISPTIM